MKPPQLEKRECRQRWAWWRNEWRYSVANKDQQSDIDDARKQMRQEAAARLTWAEVASNDRAKQFGAAHGSASLRWIAEPTRAGWWWFDRGGIHVCGNPAPLRVIDGAWITSETEMRWLEVVDPDDGRMTLGQHESKWPEGRWAGPIEPPPARYEEPTPNVRTQRAAGEDATQQD